MPLPAISCLVCNIVCGDLCVAQPLKAVSKLPWTMAESKDKKRAEALSQLFPSQPPAKQAKLDFRALSAQEAKTKQELESIDHQAAKAKEATVSTHSTTIRNKLIEKWGLEAQRPPPRRVQWWAQTKSRKMGTMLV